MKKIKIMLLSIALLAIVGGALAFKAKFEKNYCTTVTVQNLGVWGCPDAIDACADLAASTTQFIGAAATTYCYTETNGVPCDQRKDCNIYSSFTGDGN